MQTIFEIVALASDLGKVIDYLRSKSILKNDLHCDRCDRFMRTASDKNKPDGFYFRCDGCGSKHSIRTGSFLTRSKLSLGQFLVLFYLWTLKTPIEQTAIMLGITEHPVVDWCNLIREVCTAKLLFESGPTLGGPGQVVQIDESVIYKPKYHRGHALRDPVKWIFGLYDVARKVGAIEFVENRSGEVLLPLILKHIKPGTEIHSDKWAAYATISSIEVNPPYIHKTVNHSLHFKDPETGVHTNNVEAYWCSIKKRFKMLNGTSRALTASYLDEHMYRERYGRTYSEMFNNILIDIGTLGF
jgi:transposase-like protein